MPARSARAAFFAVAVSANTYAAPAAKPADSPLSDQADIVFATLAKNIEARSALSCDPAVDVPELSAKREELVFLKGERTRLDEQVGPMVALALANNGNYSVCFDKTMKSSGNAAVIYNSIWRVIALNPEAPDLPGTFMNAIFKIRQTWDKIRDNEMTMADMEAAPVILALDPAKPGAAPSALPPHRVIALVKSIEDRSAANCDPEADPGKAWQFRALNIGLSTLFVRYDRQPDILKMLEAVDRKEFSVCYDLRLNDTGNAAAIYGSASTIALNPQTRDIQPVLLQAYSRIVGNMAASEDKPVGLAAAGATPAEPPADAPRKGFRIAAPQDQQKIAENSAVPAISSPVLPPPSY